MKNRIKKLIDSLDNGLLERKDSIAIALLASLSGENIFLYGPPGTAKSLISRRLSKVFDTKNYFEYLMQKFSTPEEVFGPISLKELKQDNYIRKTEGFLPTADFAFLDEIWKSSPAILNTLLTILNEKLFRNGSNIEKVPLKVLISASNETPQLNQGLEALYDRFLVRLFIPPMNEKTNFETLLQNGATSDEIEIDENLKIKTEELNEFKKGINKVKLSRETLNIIHNIRKKFEEENKKNDFVYVSDRRWQKASLLIKASAFFSDRGETNVVDSFVLKYCLWSNKENIDKIAKIVEESIKETGFDIGINLIELDKKVTELEKEINKELFYQEDEYDEKIVNFNKNRCFKLDIIDKKKKSNVEVYFPLNINLNKKVFPVASNNKAIKWIKYKKEKNKFLIYKNKYGSDSWYIDRGNYFSLYKTINLIHLKGDKKENLPKRLISSLENDITQIKNEVIKTIKAIENRYDEFVSNSSSPFISENDTKKAFEGIIIQKENVKVLLKQCEELESLLKEFK